VLRVGGAVRIPEHLGIQVRVLVNEPRRDGQAIGVERARGAAPQAADLSDLAVAHPHVSPIGRQPRAIHDEATPYQ
jgi:hypothetical protein